MIARRRRPRFDAARELFRTSGFTAKLNEVEAYMQEENYAL